MAKPKMIEKAPDDKRAPYQRFSDLASKVLTVPKSEIDTRETQWRNAASRKKRGIK